MKVTLYTINCPKCKVLEAKLKQSEIDYDTVSNVDDVVATGSANNIRSAPFLQVDDKFFDFVSAVNYLKEVK